MTMSILTELKNIHGDHDAPFLIDGDRQVTFADVDATSEGPVSEVAPGDVVALIGDFEVEAINALLRLIDRKAILVPLTNDTRPMHDYFFEAACVNVVIEGDQATRIAPRPLDHEKLQVLRDLQHAGLVLFSSGTTGQPKAILHDFENFLVRYRTARPALRTLNFLLFDHIGGINTLLHTLYNKGVVIAPSERTPEAVLEDIGSYGIELLPTTPTFLRMILLSGLIDDIDLPSLRLVTYGTERMDLGTLKAIATKLPQVDFRQTYGMSELGIVRVKSKARDSLWMQVGGEGVETKVVDGVLHIQARNRMIGYLNAVTPFDDDGWYDTHDLVETDGEWLRIVGRDNDVINIGGDKILPETIEQAALSHPDILHAKAEGKANPVTGQHIEVLCQPREGSSVDRAKLRKHFGETLPSRFMPHRIRVGTVGVGHRFKRT